MRQGHRWAAWSVGILVGLGVLGVGGGYAEEKDEDKAKETPAVFQAAGPSAEAIQGTVEAFRAALGEPNNANDPGPLASGRREINWDGGGNNDTTAPLPPVTPFDVFLDSRGGQFTTPGTGLTQAPPSGGPQGGLATLFNNATYGDIFSTFSPLRLFTPVGSNITEGMFFIPGTNGKEPALVSGFGAVFTDVDQPDGSRRGKKHGHREARTQTDESDESRRDKKPEPRKASTRIEYFDADGKRLFSGVVPASPGDGSLSFFGIVFDEPRIARVRITTGNVAPGPDDDKKHDVVVMDDFLYGEPQPWP
jgi:hypothetical protein